MASVNFFSQDISFRLPNKQKKSTWIRKVIKNEHSGLKELNFIYCSDEYLRQVNIQYLKHKTYTDIITFDNAEETGLLEGDIFISIDRVRDNAKKMAIPFSDELDRVMIHGVLHLLGFDDKSPSNKRKMRKKEDACLSLRPKS